MFAALLICCLAFPPEDSEPRSKIEDWLRADARFSMILENAEQHRLQILLSLVDETSSPPRLERDGFRVDAEYFYPASSIKTCAAVGALLSAAEWNAKGFEISLDTPLTFLPLFDGDEPFATDPSNLEGGTITLRHEIRKLFLVSDNDAFNRMYEFTGHREIHQALWNAGLGSIRINHRLSRSRSLAENRRTPSIQVGAGKGSFSVQQRDSDLLLASNDQQGVAVGKGVMSGTKVVDGPMLFDTKNRISLTDLQDMHVMILRPEIDLGKPGLPLTPEARSFLKDTMSEYAADSKNPKYDDEHAADDYVRFILHGLMRVAPKDEWTIYDKVGLAYGFTIENAYVVHRPSGKSFFLTATIYTNEDGILNDDRYDYDSIAFPFWKDLGEVIARHVLARPSPTPEKPR